jgi:hypothetical protein
MSKKIGIRLFIWEILNNYQKIWVFRGEKDGYVPKREIK